MAFAYYSPATYDHTKVVGSVQTDFPSLVKKTDARLKHTSFGGHVRSRYGYDIKPFTDTDLTAAVSFKLVYYDPQTGTVMMYAKIASLSNAVDGTIYLGYGDPSISTDGSSTAAWNSAFTLALLPRTGITDPLRYASNPVLDRSSQSWHVEQVYDFCVLDDPTDSTKLIMFFSGMAFPAAFGEQAIGRATATKANPYVWTEHTGPVFSKSANGGDWDGASTGIRVGSVIDNMAVDGKFYLYYNDDDGGHAIGLATSTDYGVTWTREVTNPILAPTGAQTRVSGPVVMKLDATHWHMFFAYRTGALTLPGMLYATSPDGIAWTWDGGSEAISRGVVGDPDTFAIELGQLIPPSESGDGYYYFVWEGGYELASLQRQSFCIARSATFPNKGGWTKSLNNNWMTPTRVNGAWDENNYSIPRLYNWNGTWQALINGGDVYPVLETVFSMGIASLGLQTIGDLFTAPSSLDGSAAAKNFSPTGLVPIAFTGKIAASPHFNGTNNYLSCANFTVPVTGTVEFWLKCRADPYLTNMIPLTIGFEGGHPADIFHVNVAGSQADGSDCSISAGWIKDPTDKRASATLGAGIIVQDVWAHVVVTWTNGGTTAVRINKVQKATSAALNATWDTSANTMELGHFASASHFTHCDIDALRFSNVARATDWTDTSYNNENAPNTFWSFGTEEVVPVPPSSGDGGPLQRAPADASPFAVAPFLESAFG